MTFLLLEADARFRRWHVWRNFLCRSLDCGSASLGRFLACTPRHTDVSRACVFICRLRCFFCATCSVADQMTLAYCGCVWRFQWLPLFPCFGSFACYTRGYARSSFYLTVSPHIHHVTNKNASWCQTRMQRRRFDRARPREPTCNMVWRVECVREEPRLSPRGSPERDLATELGLAELALQPEFDQQEDVPLPTARRESEPKEPVAKVRRHAKVPKETRHVPQATDREAICGQRRPKVGKGSHISGGRPEMC